MPIRIALTIQSFVVMPDGVHDLRGDIRPRSTHQALPFYRVGLNHQLFR
ncbi:hypothetical protein DGo_PB0174 (plasmid) [Deinococcus gobiensis I-0]|uniref:Uncharacterized protein n=1 Tax=Deinococcus gobiensis (strain DSM 21396 / JCM 16679 / CGMCC 1.7299 / I-0) TaxID=745776 RepID=H8H1P6_DEIGI|nr:hypothetical protein DGo_PB0174 [Deinococcus gobiensis I-0]